MQFRVLAAVAAHGSFSKAAAALGQSQPAVSKTVKLLEAAFGGPLLVRAAGGVVPTGLGEDVLAHARVAIREFDQLRQMAAESGGRLAGSLRIAAPPSLCTWPLPAMLGAFRKRQPHVAVKLFEGDPDEVVSWLGSRMVDAALFTAPVADWQWTELIREPFVAVVAADSPLAAAPLSLAQLAAEPMIVSSCGIERILRAAFERADLAFASSYQTRSYSTVFAMIGEGLGIALLPRSVAERAPPGLRSVPVTDGPTRRIGLLLPPVPGRAARAFADHARAIPPA